MILRICNKTLSQEKKMTSTKKTVRNLGRLFFGLLICISVIKWDLTTVSAAPTAVLEETFADASQFTTSTAFFSDGGGDFFGISDGAGGGDFGGGSAPSALKAYTGFTGNFLTGMDLDEEGASLPITISWTGIDISGGSDLQFSADFAEYFDDPGDIDTADYLLVEAQIDSGGYVNILEFRGNDGDGFNGLFAVDTDNDGVGDGTTMGNAAQNFTAAIAGTGSTLDLQISISLDSGDEDIGIDNVTITAEFPLLDEPFDDTSQFTTSEVFFSDAGVSTGYDYYGISDGAGGGDFGGDPVPNVSAYTGFTGNFLTGQDLDGEGATLPITISWTGIDINGETDLQFSADFAEYADGSSGGIDYADFIRVEVQIDGGGYTNILEFRGDLEFNGLFAVDTDNDGIGDGATMGNEAQNFTAAIAGTGTTLDLRISCQLNSGYEDFGLDNVKITSGSVADTIPPIIQSLSPTDDAHGVTLGIDMVATFDENVQAGTGNITLYLAADDSVVEPIDVTGTQVSISGADVTINPTSDLTIDTDYYIQIDSGAIEDTSGNSFAGISDMNTWNFSTSMTRIYDIQGNGATSPLLGSIETTIGIVIGDFQDSGELSGFFLQDATGDGDATTSDGIFIYVPTSNLDWYGFDVEIGQEVQVTGRVNEYNTFTELDYVEDITIINPTPNLLAATSVSLPETTDGDLEQYEGMLISINGSLTVVQNYFLGRYGQMTLSGSGRLYQPTNQFAPGSASAIALADLNARSWLFLDDGSNAQNPAIVPYLGSPPPAVIRAGDTVSGLTGVLDYGTINSSGGRDYRLHPTQIPSFTAMNMRTPAPSSVGGSVKVASFNVLNYFVTLDGSGTICGPTGGQDCRGADSSSEFTRQRDKIVAAMCAINADVFGLMELENPNPSNDPNPGDGFSNYVLLDLVNGLNDAGSACPDKTYTFIDSAATGTDAIQVGIIYKSSTMTPASGLIVLDDAGFIDPNTTGTPKNRPAQAIAFEDSSGERFSVVVNHLKSKGSSCGAGDDDLTTGQGNCNLTRTLAAAYQRDWIAHDPTGSGDVDYLIIGDLNSYAQEDPIMAFSNNGFLNLIETLQGPNAYSYIFDGLSGYLDHAIAHSSFPAQIAGVTEWHINADEPTVIDYDENYNPSGYYSATPYRASDHDPVVIGLDLQHEVVGTVNGIVEGIPNSFPNGICGSITFTTLGTVDHVDIAYRQTHPSVNFDGLPRGYVFTAYDSGNNEVTTGFTADLTMCYADIELYLAGIDGSEEPNLHAYRYAGSDTWQEYSIVDTANNTVTAETVSALGHWGLGIDADQPTAVSLQRFDGSSGLSLTTWILAGLSVLGCGLMLLKRRNA